MKELATHDSSEVKRSVLNCRFVPVAGRSGLGLGHFVHRCLPSAFRHFRIRGCQICPGDMQVQDLLAMGFVL
jgi:hypothetical protein